MPKPSRRRSRLATIRAANAALLVDGDLDAVGEFFTADYVAHGTGRDLAGHAAVRRFVAALRRAVPDLSVEIEIFVEGTRRIAWQRTLRGTQRGALFGFPASGRRIVWRDMFVSRFKGWRFCEDHVVTDLA